jgi:membrane dipeptidase
MERNRGSRWVADFHCDTLFETMRHGGDLRSRPQGQLDVERLEAAGVDLQVFAVFSHPASPRDSLHDALLMVEVFWQAVDQGLLRPVLWREDMQETAAPVRGMLSMEGAEPLQGDVDLLRLFLRLGVRALGLTWNGRNALADGVDDAITGGGLTVAGRRVVAEMNRLGMLVDVSHLSEGGFWDVVSECRGPFIASHSNARAICPHRRNLSDAQLCAVAASGGVVGINFCPPFLTATGQAGISDILEHAEHMLSVMGRGHVGLGSDFDGVRQLPEGIMGVEALPALAQAFEKEFGSEVAAELMGGSFTELLAIVLPAAPQGVPDR